MSFECRGEECQNFDANCQRLMQDAKNGEGTPFFDESNVGMLVKIAKGTCANSAEFVASADLIVKPDDCGYIVREEFLDDPIAVMAERAQ